ncbi:MAG: [FeFe] hydrogenase H-cluster radical SAM maturase HydE [Duodenibacillus sp.]|nr:[FeFe] hydrogenase H-cluster radical SAM maturase HydE [Duodenibacillus sp.]
MELNNLAGRGSFTRDELARLIALEDPAERELLYAAAREVKARRCGLVTYYRGLIEFSNVCTKDCLYCGIRKSNHACARYELSREDVLAQARWIHGRGIGSLVLQSGERSDPKFVAFVEGLVRDIKALSGGRLGITLAAGEQTEETYARWFAAGAHRYLLRIESSSPALYAGLHPDDGKHRWDVRDRCLALLRRCGYQVGTGVMIGLPGQTPLDLADDLLYFRDRDVDMIGMGPYVVARGTPLGQAAIAAGGDAPEARARRLALGLNMVAACRLLLKDVNIASTTALQTLHPDGLMLGIRAGANVCMPSATPEDRRASYQLYDNKSGVDDSALSSLAAMNARVAAAGDAVALSDWGDSRHFFARAATGKSSS